VSYCSAPSVSTFVTPKVTSHAHEPPPTVVVVVDVTVVTVTLVVLVDEVEVVVVSGAVVVVEDVVVVDTTFPCLLSSSQPIDATARNTATPSTDRFLIQVVIPIISLFRAA